MNRAALVTCGLPYVNGPAHIAHLRTYVPADIFVRLLRKLGQEVVFICGSDTHGTPITVKAEAEGVTPLEIIKEYHKHFLEFFPRMGIRFTNYGSTDHPLNHSRTIQIMDDLRENGHVYANDLKLPYCPNCDRFLPDRYQKGTCPHCGASARGDECDQGCGRYLEPGELIDTRCGICRTKPEKRETRHYFLKLTTFEGFLTEYLQGLDGTEIARNYAKKWVEGGLKDWNITRNLDWGVKVPGEPGLVYYVWVDAPIGYIASTEEWAERTGGNWKYYWKGEGSLIHFIGPGIIYHHCLFWPSMLKGAGYNVPDAVIASGTMKVEGHVFSKSRGYVIWVEEDYLEKGLDPDALRYYIASYTGHNRDLDFAWHAYGEKVNKELVGTLGNFLYRTILFAHRNYQSVPEGKVDPMVMAEVENTIEKIRDGLDEYEFKKIADSIIGLAAYGNRYLQSGEPWKLTKTDPEKAAETIHNCLWLIKALAVLMEAIFPFKAKEVWRQLGTPKKDTLIAEALMPLDAGTPIAKPTPIFEQVSKETIAELSELVSKRIEEASG
ncbi:MAG: methionine--tRNA ligase [Candidatus Bathyarchaeota archaeon]|nr:methionine--tRNA ligase [Candidatus Bathyarchaeota archaeon]